MRNCSISQVLAEELSIGKSLAVVVHSDSLHLHF